MKNFVYIYMVIVTVYRVSHGVGMAKESRTRTGKQKLYIGGIFPMTGTSGWIGGEGCKPAVEMAFEDVNARPDILPGYQIEMVSNNSECKAGLGMNALYDLLYNKPQKLMLLGPGCSVVSTFVGQAAHMWNLVVLSYGASSPALSNKDRFPTFFRTHPSATIHNPTRIKLFQRFGWKRIASIQETQEVFTSTFEDLEIRAKQAKIRIDPRTSFLTDPANAVRQLKQKDARIIVGLFYEGMARRVFCEAYHNKLYGPKHVWYIIGWYADSWYATPDNSINCTAEQMRETLQGHFTTEGLMLNQGDAVTVSGMTSSTFAKKMEARVDPRNATGYVESPLAYDAVWALVLALNKTETRLKEQNRSLTEFNYTNEEIKEEIYSAMNTTNFLGVSGQVAFNSKGDRIAWTQIEQMWDGDYTVIGYYHSKLDSLTWYNNVRWPDGRVPQDQTILRVQLQSVSDVLFIIMSLLASIGIVAAFSLCVFNCLHRRKRYMLLSQPDVNSLILIGCIVCLFCIYLQALDGRHVTEQTFIFLCKVRCWLLCTGFSLAYGSMFSKVWTIYKCTIRKKKSEIPDFKQWELYMTIGIFLVLDVAILVLWQVFDEWKRNLEDFPPQPSQDSNEDIMIMPQLEHCSSRDINIWLGIMFGYKGIVLLFGILLAYETRNVKFKQINDSRFVGMSIYNVVVLCLITGPVSLIISSHQDASFTFVAIAILLSSFLTMGLIFVPKIIEVKRDMLREYQDSTALTESVSSRVDEERHRRLIEENEQLQKQIAQKEERIKDLHRRLQLKAQYRAQLPVPDIAASSQADNHIDTPAPPGDAAVNQPLKISPNPAGPNRLAQPLCRNVNRCMKDKLSVLETNSDSAVGPASSLGKTSSKVSENSADNYSESYC